MAAAPIHNRGGGSGRPPPQNRPHLQPPRPRLEPVDREKVTSTPFFINSRFLFRFVRVSFNSANMSYFIHHGDSELYLPVFLCLQTCPLLLRVFTKVCTFTNLSLFQISFVLVMSEFSVSIRSRLLG